jgi:transposase-like protein
MEKQAKFPQTLIEAIRYFADPDVAVQFMASIRWPEGAKCPSCESTNVGYISTRRVWQCKGCKKQFTVKLGTVMEDSPISLDKWLCAIWMIAMTRTGLAHTRFIEDLA